MGKRGPAAKGEFGDKSAVLSTRISADLRAWLEKAKAESGLTLSREIEFRLRRTFTVDETIKESFGSRRNRALMKMLSMAMETTSRPDSSSERDWMDDPWLFDQVVRTLNNILRAIRPPGEAESPWAGSAFAESAEAIDRIGAREKAAALVVGVARGDASLPLDVSKSQRIVNLLKSDLGDVVQRPQFFEGNADEIRAELARRASVKNHPTPKRRKAKK
jgi:hypothetical protein